MTLAFCQAKHAAARSWGPAGGCCAGKAPPCELACLIGEQRQCCKKQAKRLSSSQRSHQRSREWRESPKEKAPSNVSCRRNQLLAMTLQAMLHTPNEAVVLSCQRRKSPATRSTSAVAQQAPCSCRLRRALCFGSHRSSCWLEVQRGSVAPKKRWGASSLLPATAPCWRCCNDR